MENTKNIDSMAVNEVNPIENVKFIDGTFNTEDASEILLAVLNDKINFHSSLLLSNIERFGVDTSNSEKRIHELRAEKKRVIVLIKEAKESGELVKIGSTISIELIGK
jgi:23S rRNA U2552 (ribose-2'-O)-methylase RlmE/FtsJ